MRPVTLFEEYISTALDAYFTAHESSRKKNRSQGAAVLRVVGGVRISPARASVVPAINWRLLCFKAEVEQFHAELENEQKRY